MRKKECTKFIKCLMFHIVRVCNMCSDFYSKYKLIGKIGEGTFSEVLKCQSYNSGELFAVKKLKKQYNQLTVAENLPELLILQKLASHPNVLTLLEYIFDTKEGRLFMVFELMEMSLYELIQSRKRCLPETRVKHMFYQILKGVDYLHSNGIFHRDIKPENILVKKVAVKLADLGSVRGTHSQQPYTEYISTRWYRSPECILTHGCYGPKMDVWACGCVYFELLTSKPIFPGANEVDQLTKIHQIIGTPNPRVMLKMRRSKSRVGDVRFASYPAINMAVLLPFTSDGGREVLRRMLVYDPEVRSNVRRLIEHRYFNDLRERENLSKHSNILVKQWSSPAMYNVDSTKTSKLKSNNAATNEKKTTKTKLTTHTWAPSTNTTKVVVMQNKSKVPIAMKLPPATVKKRLGKHVAQGITKHTEPLKPSLIPSPIKQSRNPSKYIANLPSLNNYKSISLKSQANGFRTTKSFLPPILEN